MESCLCKVRYCDLNFGFAYHKTLQILLGVTLSLRGNCFPTDGSGRIVITDINPDGDSEVDALICRSVNNITSGGNWYLHPTQQTTDDSDRMQSTDN